MSYLITYRRRAGQGAIPVHASGMSEAAARAMAGQLAHLSRQVTLTELDDNGVQSVIDRWVGGKRDMSGLNSRPTPRVIDHEPDADTAPELDAAAEEDEAVEDTAEVDHDDEAHRYTARCFRCKEPREFIGRIVELSNGSRAAKGNCTVCGSGLMRMVARTTPLDEWTDEDAPAVEPQDDTAPGVADEDYEAEGTVTFPAVEMDVEAEPDLDEQWPAHSLTRVEGRKGIRLECECGEWSTGWIKAGSAQETNALADYSEHEAEATNTGSDSDEPTPEPVEADDAPPMVAFSDAVGIVQEAEELAPAVAEVVTEQAEVEKPKRAPRKRASRAKAKEEAPPVSDEELKRVQDMEVAFCPKCENPKVPIMERAGLRIYTVHPDTKHGTDRCTMSTSEVTNLNR